MTLSSPKDVFEYAKKHDVKYIDLRFTDFPGTLQHFTIPATQIDEMTFEEGLGFDGSSIRGWQQINESDMVVVPDPTTAKIDPFFADTTLTLLCDVKDPISGENYSRDPRNVARKAEQYLEQSGLADKAFFGPEAEFYVFDDLRFENNEFNAAYRVNSDEAIWNSGGERDRIFGERQTSALGHKNRLKEGYFPVPPSDTQQDLRSRMVNVMQSLGIEVECHHHEVGAAGQGEIDIRFNTLLSTADNLQLYKYVVKNVARQAGKSVTFMPKPIFGDNGSGMHVHQSLWKGDSPLFAGDKYGGLSELAEYYIGGLLKHGKAVLAFAAPTTNSYKRLVPGYEAPVNLVYSSRNRSAAVRIPMYSKNPKAKRIEFRPPDPSCNPYLAFAAMLMAGLDGIKNKIAPPKPVDKNIYSLTKEELAALDHVPSSLEEAINALEADHQFLLEGGVFTKDVIETYIEYRREEILQLRLRPHPFEFHLYSDV